MSVNTLQTVCQCAKCFMKHGGLCDSSPLVLREAKQNKGKMDKGTVPSIIPLERNLAEICGALTQSKSLIQFPSSYDALDTFLAFLARPPPPLQNHGCVDWSVKTKGNRWLV